MPANRVPLRFGSQHPDPDERPQAGSVGGEGGPLDGVIETARRLYRMGVWTAPGDEAPENIPDPAEMLEWSDWVGVLGAVDRHGANEVQRWIAEYLSQKGK